MSLAEAGIYSLVGILTVFFALILLMFVIRVLTKLTDESPEKKSSTAVCEDDAAAKDSSHATGRPLAPGSAGDIKLYDTDLRDAAMIMAIVADELKKPINELRFISIKEVK